MKKILLFLLTLILALSLSGCGFLEPLLTTTEKTTKSTQDNSQTSEVISTKGSDKTTEEARTTVPDIELLERPIITCDKTGKATWSKIDNAIGYEYYLNGIKNSTEDVITVELNNHDTLKVIAIGDMVNFQNSLESELFTFVNLKLTSPKLIDNNGTFTWQEVDGASSYEYYIKRDGIDLESVITYEPADVRLKPNGDTIYVRAICDFDSSLNSDYSSKQLMLYTSSITLKAEEDGYCSWTDVPYASFYFVTINGVQLNDRIYENRIRVDSGSKVSVKAVYAYTYYELTLLTYASNEVTVNWTPTVTSKLDAPILSIDMDGCVTVSKNENVKGFNYKFGETGEVNFTYSNEIKIPKYESLGLYVQSVGFNGGCASSDYSSPIYYIVLPTPMVKAYDGSVYWEEVIGATSYDVNINGVVSNQKTTVINAKAGDKVMVKAKGEEYLDSYYSTVLTVNYSIPTVKSFEEMKKYSSEYYYNQLNDKEKQLYNLIDAEAYKVYSGEKNVDSSLEFANIKYSTLGLNDQSVQKVFLAYRNEHNFYFWIDRTYSYGSYLVLKVSGDYETSSIRRETEKYLFELLDNMKTLTQDLTSDLEKAKVVHDEMLKALFYSYDEMGYPSDTSNAHSTAGYVLEGKGVCECYARTFELIMNYLGVETIYVTGDAYSGGSYSGHAWNMINIDGSYYWCDLTWDDDQCNFSNLYDFFMVSSSDIIREYKFSDTHKEDLEFSLPIA